MNVIDFFCPGKLVLGNKQSPTFILAICLKYFILFLFFFNSHPIIGREGGKERERESAILVQETNIDRFLGCPQTGDGTRNPGMCPDQGSNLQLFDIWNNVNQLSHPAKAVIFGFTYCVLACSQFVACFILFFKKYFILVFLGNFL